MSVIPGITLRLTPIIFLNLYPMTRGMPKLNPVDMTHVIICHSFIFILSAEKVSRLTLASVEAAFMLIPQNNRYVDVPEINPALKVGIFPCCSLKRDKCSGSKA